MPLARKPATEMFHNKILYFPSQPLLYLAEDRGSGWGLWLPDLGGASNSVSPTGAGRAVGTLLGFAAGVSGAPGVTGVMGAVGVWGVAGVAGVANVAGITRAAGFASAEGVRCAVGVGNVAGALAGEDTTGGGNGPKVTQGRCGR